VAIGANFLLVDLDYFACCSSRQQQFSYGNEYGWAGDHRKLGPTTWRGSWSSPEA